MEMENSYQIHCVTVSLPGEEMLLTLLQKICCDCEITTLLCDTNSLVTVKSSHFYRVGTE